MGVRIVRKPPTSKGGSDRLKVSLLGTHPLDAKVCMFLQTIAFLQHRGFTHAGPADLYLPLIDRSLHPLTIFPDGTPIAEHFITIADPYACAADDYDRKFSPPPPRPF
jgi:hypothetical protein